MDKRERKMTAEQLAQLLHMRKRGMYVAKNKKAYKRKEKHKKDLTNQD